MAELTEAMPTTVRRSQKTTTVRLWARTQRVIDDTRTSEIA